jgi:hypothetical protein
MDVFKGVGLEEYKKELTSNVSSETLHFYLLQASAKNTYIL